MSQENLELVKSLHPPSGTDLVALFGAGAGESGRLDGFASLLTSDFEAVGGDLRGGLVTNGRGIEGLLKVWREWLAPYETYTTAVEDFIDAGDDQVVVLVRDHARSRGSDREVDLATGAVWTLREGKIARIEFHTKREDALEAAGLSE